MSRWLLRLTFGLILTIFILIGLVALIVATPVGVKLALWGAEQALPDFRVEESEGALLGGFTLKGIHYKDDLMTAGVREADINLRGKCLLTPAVCLDAVKLDGVTFSMPQLPPPSPESETPSEPLTSVSLPLPVAVKGLVLNDISLDILGNQVSWKHFESGASMSGDKLVLTPTQWDGIRLSLAESKPEAKTAEKKPASDEASHWCCRKYGFRFLWM